MTYLNVDPTIVSKLGMEGTDLSMSFEAIFADDDLANNNLIAGFEELATEISLTDAFGSGFLSRTGTTLIGSLDRQSLIDLFGGPGTFSVFANVMDKAGAIASMGFDVTLSKLPAGVPEPDTDVPEPETLVLFGFGLAGLGYIRRRRLPKNSG